MTTYSLETTHQKHSSQNTDFCIVILVGRNQIEIKDNHGHTTKVHHRGVKKIPMTDKVCQLYKEEQVGKVREGRKAVPSSKMPDLGWDIAKTQLQKDYKQTKYQESLENHNLHTTTPLKTLIMIAVLIITILKSMIVCAQGIPKTARKAVQTIKSTTKKISQNKLQNIKQSYETAILAVKVATSITNCTSHTDQHHTTTTVIKTPPGMQKSNNRYDGPDQPHTSRTHQDNYN